VGVAVGVVVVTEAAAAVVVVIITTQTSLTENIRTSMFVFCVLTLCGH
jgi:hypothetical protein